MPTDQDAQLVAACLSGDRKAFGVLMDLYEKKLFNVAYRVVGNYEDAMDATQSTFVKAYEKLDTFDPRYRFFSWIYRILLNESLNIVNRRKNHDCLDDVELTSSGRNPEEDYGAKETGETLQTVLDELKPENRAVVVLKHFHNLSYREISDILAIPEKTVKSRLFTARQQLREMLRKRGIER